MLKVWRAEPSRVGVPHARSRSGDVAPLPRILRAIGVGTRCIDHRRQRVHEPLAPAAVPCEGIALCRPQARIGHQIGERLAPCVNERERGHDQAAQPAVVLSRDRVVEYAVAVVLRQADAERVLDGGHGVARVISRRVGRSDIGGYLAKGRAATGHRFAVQDSSVHVAPVGASSTVASSEARWVTSPSRPTRVRFGGSTWTMAIAREGAMRKR